jgi:hypothetical protein
MNESSRHAPYDLRIPAASPRLPETKYNSEDQNKGHDHTFFIQLSRDVFAD